YRDPNVQLYSYRRVGNTINFNVFQKNLRPLDLDATCGFADQQFRLRELCAVEDATPKQGQHDPVGVLMIRGPGIQPGTKLGECTNLDIAPTLLHLAGIEPPAYMKGRVLHEALSGAERRELVAASEA
ncbi:MAG: hypothetical protein ACREQV_05895, partial [Candidatus Binatia bacterium]